MQDVAYKAELRDPVLARAIAGGIGARRAAEIRQRDTYFRVATGRLKRREASVDGLDEAPEYIRYSRDTRLGPRITRFEVYSEEEFRERFGEQPLPEWVVVEKVRTVLVAGGARVHLDEVAGLGWFFEAECLVTPKQNVARAHEQIEALRRAFAPALGEPIATGYAELVAAEAQRARA